MKATGIVRKMDELGRIVVPKELRKVFNINEGDSIEIFTDGDNILFKKYSPGCNCCSNIDNLVEVCGIKLCTSCLGKFKDAAKYTDKLRGCNNEI